jgi:hypothetical protein
MVAQVIWPLEVWQSGTNENSLPANDNALRMQAVADAAIGVADSAPGSPSEDDQYIIGTTWGGFTTGNIVIYKGGTWLEFESFEGQLKSIGGDVYQFDGSDWNVIAGGGSAPNVQTVTSSATVTPTYSNDVVEVTAQAAGLTIANPSGTAVNGHGLVIRVKDNGTSRSLTWGSEYRAVGVVLPSATVLGKWHYFACIRNSTDGKMDVLAAAVEA